LANCQFDNKALSQSQLLTQSMFGFSNSQKPNFDAETYFQRDLFRESAPDTTFCCSNSARRTCSRSSTSSAYCVARLVIAGNLTGSRWTGLGRSLYVRFGLFRFIATLVSSTRLAVGQTLFVYLKQMLVRANCEFNLTYQGYPESVFRRA
jgi:hypothetical protein